MTGSASTAGGRRGVLAVAALITVSVAIMTVWFARRAAWEGAVAERLGAYAATGLPDATAPVDTVLANLGSEIFRRSCSACHSIGGGVVVGPDLAGVTERRGFPWIRAMVLTPDSMTTADPEARALRDEYQVQMMTPAYLQSEHALAVLEFLRRADAGRAGPPAP